MRALFVCPLVLLGCGKSVAPPIDAGTSMDAAVEPIDSGIADSGSFDAGPRDAGLPYRVEIFDAGRISSNGSQPNFHILRAPVELVRAPFASVTLVADLSSTCFPFESWQQNPPPAGQKWPADCDAFDRNFEFTLDPPTDAGQPPAFELIRAITPFGGPLHVEADLTDLANAFPGTHTIQVEIPTYSDGAGQVSGSNGGWTISAHLEVVPGDAPRNVVTAIPLFNRSQGPGASVNAAFDVPAGVTAARLEYRATGHGGAAANTALCIGPADEFCKRTHHVLVDSAEAQTMVPWRNDCQNNCTIAHYGAAGAGFDYCAQNPCGNINSVKAPRANWCPGTVTPPVILDPLPFHVEGPHQFNVTIDDVANGGVWRQSATLYLFRD
jgi:hypothetical protein